MDYVEALVLRLDSVQRGISDLISFWLLVKHRIRGWDCAWSSRLYRETVVETAPWFPNAPRGANTSMFGDACERQFAATAVDDIYAFLQRYNDAVSMWMFALGRGIFMSHDTDALATWRDIFSAENAHLRRSSGAWAVLLDTDIFVRQLGKALKLSFGFRGSPAARALLMSAQQVNVEVDYWNELKTMRELMHGSYDPMVLFAGAPDFAAPAIAALPKMMVSTWLFKFVDEKLQEACKRLRRAHAMYLSIFTYEAFVQRPMRLKVVAHDIMLYVARDALATLLPRIVTTQARNIAAAQATLDALQNQLDALQAYATELRVMGAACMQAGAAGFVPHVKAMACMPALLGCL